MLLAVAGYAKGGKGRIDSFKERNMLFTQHNNHFNKHIISRIFTVISNLRENEVT